MRRPRLTIPSPAGGPVPRLRSLACIFLLAAPGAALAQAVAQNALPEPRRQRLEMIEKTQAAAREAWRNFTASADKDGVRLECGAPPARAQVVLYRGYAFSTEENGGLSSRAYRYGQAGGVLSWEDFTGARWTLQRDRWLLSEAGAAAQGKEPVACRKIRGDESEIDAPPPEFPRVK